MSEHEDPFFARLQRVWQSGSPTLPPRINEEQLEQLAKKTSPRLRQTGRR